MADTEEAIMEATRQALVDHGFRDLTTQKVADVLGKSHSLIHYHYDTKEDLVVAFLEHYRGQMETLLAAFDEEPPGTRLASFLALMAGYADDPDVRGLNLAVYELQAYAGRNEAYRDPLLAYNRALCEFVTDCIEAGVEDGTFHEVDPETTARVLLTALDGALLQQYTVGVDTVERVAFDGLVEYVLADLYVDDPPDLRALADAMDAEALGKRVDDAAHDDRIDAEDGDPR